MVSSLRPASRPPFNARTGLRQTVELTYRGGGGQQRKPKLGPGGCDRSVSNPASARGQSDSEMDRSQTFVRPETDVGKSIIANLQPVLGRLAFRLQT